ncbi:hypothetical protein TWF281_006713 [Arthrobotrys megalospora]
MAASSVPSTALISFQSGGDSGFSNSGQVDWVTLAGSSVKFTVDVLARLSKAGIEAFTLAASYAVLGRFRISHIAETRIQESVGKLGAFSSFSNALYFGFGVKHIVRNLADSSEGLSILTICAILSDFYGTDYAGQILRELFKLLQPPIDLTPTLLQWRNLVKACAGALSHSNFNHHLTHMCRLYCNGTGKPPTQFSRGNHIQIAAALHELCQVVAGKTNEAVFVGGTDCALIAAIASWVLDLNVEIREKDRILFKHASATRKSASGYLVAVVYNYAGTESSKGPLELTKISGYRRIIEFQQLFTTSSKEIPLHMAASTRLDWSSALSDILGPYSQELLSGSGAELAGRLFGYLMAQALWEKPTQPTLPELRRSSYFWKYTNKSSQGMGLLEVVEKWFSESVDTVFSRTAAARYKNLLEIKTVLLGYYGDLTTAEWSDIYNLPGLEDELKHLSPLSTDSMPREALLDFIWFLYYVCRCLSSCQVCESVLPSRAGLLFLYEHGRQVFSTTRRTNILGGRKVTPDTTQLMGLGTYDIPPLVIAEIMFGRSDAHIRNYHSSGTAMHTPGTGTSGLRSALSLNGICFVLNSLIQLTDDYDEVGRLSIFAGTIHYQGEYFDRIIDNQGPYPVADYNFTEGVTPPQPDNRPRLCLGDLRDCKLEELVPQYLDTDEDEGFSTELLISDTSELPDQLHNSTLWAHYRLSKGCNRDKILNLRPAEFVNVVFGHTDLNSNWACNRLSFEHVPTRNLEAVVLYNETSKPSRSQSHDLEFKPVSLQALTTAISGFSKVVLEDPSSAAAEALGGVPRWPSNLNPLGVLVDDFFIKVAILMLHSEKRSEGVSFGLPLTPLLNGPSCLHNTHALTKSSYLKSIDILRYGAPVIILQRR